MSKNRYDYNWQQVLFDTLSDIQESTQMSRFLNDVMTKKEIDEISSRLKSAVMLSNNEKYADISKQTGLSSRTVARISDWLKQNNGGYSQAVAFINKHHLHM